LDKSKVFLDAKNKLIDGYRLVFMFRAALELAVQISLEIDLLSGIEIGLLLHG